jgi:hypothetical protein
MKRFRVVWRRSALNALADAWTQAKNRQAVNSAVDAIEDKLAENPTEFGDRRVEGLYFFSEPPLRIAFTVDENLWTVTIDGLWTPPPGRQM